MQFTSVPMFLRRVLRIEIYDFLWSIPYTRQILIFRVRNSETQLFPHTSLKRQILISNAVKSLEPQISCLQLKESAFVHSSLVWRSSHRNLFSKPNISPSSVYELSSAKALAESFSKHTGNYVLQHVPSDFGPSISLIWHFSPCNRTLALTHLSKRHPFLK